MKVVINDVSVEAVDLEWSNVDPGGCESAMIRLEQGQAPQPRAEVLIYDGNECVFEGEVEEPGQRHSRGVASANITGVGVGAVAKRRYFDMTFIDRDLGQWKAPSITRELALANTGFPLNDNGGFRVEPDETTGLPSLILAFTNMVTTAGRKPIIEAWYDIGPSQAIASLGFSYRSYDKGAGGLNLLSGSWQAQALMSSDEAAATSDATTDFADGTTGTKSLDATTDDRRYAFIELLLNAVSAVGDGDWKIMLDCLRVIGNHNIDLFGSGYDEGVHPHDVVRWLVQELGEAWDINIEESTKLVVPHLVYRDRTAVEQGWADMSILNGGWHWGVWPRTLFGTTPQFIFSSPPRLPTAIVRYDELEDPDITERASVMFNRATVNYNKADGTLATVTVDIPHPRLPNGDISETVLSLGQSGALAAAAIGRAMLLTQQIASRMSGSILLPEYIRSPSGGKLKSSLLRSGIDRIQIVGLPIGDNRLLDSSIRSDTFHIRRASNAHSAGATRTTVEIDTGSDLIETLNARLAANAVGIQAG